MKKSLSYPENYFKISWVEMQMLVVKRRSMGKTDLHLEAQGRNGDCSGFGNRENTGKFIDFCKFCNGRLRPSWPKLFY